MLVNVFILVNDFKREKKQTKHVQGYFLKWSCFQFSISQAEQNFKSQVTHTIYILLIDKITYTLIIISLFEEF